MSEILPDDHKSNTQLMVELAEARQLIATLRESEQRFRHLFEGSPDAVFVADYEGYILDVNTAACLLQGRTRDDLLGKHLTQLVSPTEQVRVEQAFKRITSGKISYLEGFNWTSEQHNVPVEVRTSQVEYFGTLAILLHVRDITIRKQNEAILQQQNEYFTALHETTLGMISRLDLHELLETLVQRVGQLFDTPHGFVALVNNNATFIEIKVGLGLFEGLIGLQMEPNEGVSGRVWQSRQALTIENYDMWLHRADNHPYQVVRAVVGVPLTHTRQNEVDVIGVLGIAHSFDNTDRFDDESVDLLDRFAQLASVAIDNARLYQRAERRASEMATLVTVGRQISATLDLPTVLRRIAVSAKELLQATDAAIYLKEPGSEGFKAIVALGNYVDEIMADVIMPGQGIIGHVIETKQAERVENILTDPRSLTIPGTEIDPSAPESMMCVPLISRDDLIGLMALWCPHTVSIFSQHDLDFLIGIARQATIAIDNAQLFRNIQREKRHFETVVKNSPVAIVTMNFEYSITSWNPAAEKLFGYREAEVIAKDPHELLATDANQDIVMVGDTIRTITRCRRKDGSLVDVETFDVPVIDAGEVIALFAMYHDISQLQQERRQAEAAHEAMGSFLASVSHELRTPLTSVLGFAKIIQKRMNQRIFPAVNQDTPKVERAMKQVKQNLEIIVSEGERLTEMINNVLDLAKIEAGKVEWQIQPLKISEVINQATTATFSLFAEKRLPLYKKIDSGLPHLKGDKNKLIQVMINLLSNAVKFTASGGVTCQVTQESQHIIVSVTDTGIGIAEADLPNVFEKFKQIGDTLTDKPQGTGLGLPICKEIINYHGGEIWASSEQGEGSTFSFSLPINHGHSYDEQPAITNR